MKQFQFNYMGKVRGQMRPRFSTHGAYKDKKDREYEKAIRDAFIAAGGFSFGSDPIEMYIDVFRELPKSRPDRVISEPDTFKPDTTNIAKSVEDALNGVAYDDDKQITLIVCRKHARMRREEHLRVLIVKAREE